MPKQIDILEVRAQYVPKGAAFYGDECMTHVVVDGAFVPLDEVSEAGTDDDADNVTFCALRDLWAFRFYAVGDGQPDQCLLQVESQATGWEDVLGKHAAALVRDAVAIKGARVDRARNVRVPLLTEAETLEARAALARAEEAQPTVFLAAVEVHLFGLGEEQDAEVRYHGRIDCARLRQVVADSPDLAEQVNRLNRNIAAAQGEL